MLGIVFYIDHVKWLGNRSVVQICGVVRLQTEVGQQHNQSRAVSAGQLQPS